VRETGFMAAHAAASETRIDMKLAVARAPIWVIAIMAHLLLFAVLGMLYVRQDETKPREDGRRLIITEGHDDRTKLTDDTIPVQIPLIRPPVVPDDALPDDVLVTGCVWPDLSEPTDPNDVPGLPDAPGRVLMQPSPLGGDGQGLGAPGAIGPGGGSNTAGGGGTKGTGQRLINPRVARGQPFRPRIDPMLTGGLRWLREHQSEDGMWDCDGFPLRCDVRLGPECEGRGSPTFDVGVTGLALLAFLGAGYDGRGQTLNDEAVQKALKWLRSVQDVEGCFGPRGDKFTYSHACATIAMCEAATFNKSFTWRKSAQQAIEFVQATQTPYRGWRYGVRPGESDVSVTGWMLLALKAGKDAGLTVSDRAIRDGLAFLDSMTDPQTGRTGYQKRDEMPVRPEGSIDRWPGDESESLTAVAMCARIFLGREENHPLTQAGVARLSKKPPLWEENKGTIDMYYWYYGTLAMHQVGGPAWDQWIKSLEAAVIPHQIKSGCAEGSWDPKDPWGAEGGRVYATAMMTLCLEVYWRYPFVFGSRR
jgi:hypothetical protein